MTATGVMTATGLNNSSAVPDDIKMHLDPEGGYDDPAAVLSQLIVIGRFGRENGHHQLVQDQHQRFAHESLLGEHHRAHSDEGTLGGVRGQT